MLPTVNKNLNLIENESVHENRAMASKPKIDLKHLDAYVKKYDNYYTDRFSLRNNFIKLLNQFEYSVFKVSATPAVIMGKDGWFYDKNDYFNYKGANLFTSTELTAFREELRKRTKWAAEKGIKYYLVVVPDKMTVYPEHLPSKIIQLSNLTRYDQIVALNNEPEINIIDIKTAILKHKNDGRDLYQHTDEHWNELGAFYGYEKILNRLSADFPELKPMPLSNFTINVGELAGGTAKEIYAEKDYPEKFIALSEKNKLFAHEGTLRGYPAPKEISLWDAEMVRVNENGKTLKCLVIRDSFTLLMIKFLSEHFKETIFIHDAWRCRMREDIILKENPDIVLNIVLETKIENLIMYPFSPGVEQQPEKKSDPKP